jgi:hypothetical protein
LMPTLICHVCVCVRVRVCVFTLVQGFMVENKCKTHWHQYLVHAPSK